MTLKTWNHFDEWVWWRWWQKEKETSLNLSLSVLFWSIFIPEYFLYIIQHNQLTHLSNLFKRLYAVTPTKYRSTRCRLIFSLSLSLSHTHTQLFTFGLSVSVFNHHPASSLFHIIDSVWPDARIKVARFPPRVAPKGAEAVFYVERVV